MLTECKSLESNFLTSFTYLINQRQISLLSKIATGLEGAILSYKQTLDITILISSLYSVRDIFNTLVRPNDKDEILNKIFKGFCIGK